MGLQIVVVTMGRYGYNSLKAEEMERLRDCKVMLWSFSQQSSIHAL